MNQGPISIDKIKSINGNYSSTTIPNVRTYFYVFFFGVLLPIGFCNSAISEEGFGGNGWAFLILYIIAVSASMAWIWIGKISFTFSECLVSRVFPGGKKVSIRKEDIISAQIERGRYGILLLELETASTKMVMPIEKSLQSELE